MFITFNHINILGNNSSFVFWCFSATKNLASKFSVSYNVKITPIGPSLLQITTLNSGHNIKSNHFGTLVSGQKQADTCWVPHGKKETVPCGLL